MSATAWLQRLFGWFGWFGWLGCVGLLALSAFFTNPAHAQPAERNTRHALIIGIGDYLDPDIPILRGTVHDVASARRMARAMAVPDANVRILRDTEATAERIRSEIGALGQRVRDGDRVFIYYSGHGTRWLDEKAQDKTQDKANRAPVCTEGLLATDGEVLGNTELAERLAPLARRADKMMVFYDACFSGGIAGQPARTRSASIGNEVLTPKFTPKFSRAGNTDACATPSNFRTRSLAPALQQSVQQAQNVVHIAASRPDEASFDSSTIGGFATAAWRDCLLGQAQDLDGSGAITVEEITRCAQAKIDAALASQPGILGQRMTVGGNAGFVPAWMGERFGAAGSRPGVGHDAALAAAIEANAVLAALMGVPKPAALAATVPATAPLPPAARPADILAEMHRQRDGARSVVATARQGQLKIGRDALEIDITAARDGHLYVALAGSDGKSLYLLYPNDLARDTRVRAGQRIGLPGPGWDVVSAGPPGPETLLVMVSDAPRDLSALQSALGRDKAGPFVKTLLDEQGRSRLQWVLANGTPAADCGKPGAASCSDAFGAALVTVQAVP